MRAQHFGCLMVIGSALLLAPSHVQGQARTPEQIVAAVPVEVPEVATGGSWTERKSNGVYRAVVVLSGADKEAAARVFLQWIVVKPDSLVPEVARTVAIKEVNDKKLSHAFINLQADKEGEAILIVTSIDPQTSKEQTFAFKATKPGTYAVTAPPKVQQ